MTGCHEIVKSASSLTTVSSAGSVPEPSPSFEGLPSSKEEPHVPQRPVRQVRPSHGRTGGDLRRRRRLTLGAELGLKAGRRGPPPPPPVPPARGPPPAPALPRVPCP